MRMALVGWEWIAVIGIVAIILLWGPKKLPELARGLGQAKREFDKSSKEFSSAIEQAASSPEATYAKAAAEDPLIETARKLGIKTEGKTKQQISQEIVERAQPSQPKNPSA